MQDRANELSEKQLRSRRVSPHVLNLRGSGGEQEAATEERLSWRQRFFAPQKSPEPEDAYGIEYTEAPRDFSRWLRPAKRKFFESSALYGGYKPDGRLRRALELLQCLPSRFVYPAIGLAKRIKASYGYKQNSGVDRPVEPAAIENKSKQADEEFEIVDMFAPLDESGGLGGAVSREEAKTDDNEKLEEKQSGAPAFIAHLRPALAFASVLLLMALPFKTVTLYEEALSLKNRVLGVTAAAIDEMGEGVDSAANREFSHAGEKFSQAGSGFQSARDQIKGYNEVFALLSLISSDERIQAASQADDILAAGELAARLADELSRLLAIFDREEKNVKAILDLLAKRSRELRSLTLELQERISRIDPAYLPAEYREKFSFLKKRSAVLSGGFIEMTELIHHLRQALGCEYDKRYLLVFQNNAEMRASGGFIGSFAEVTLRDGQIRDIYAPGGGSYDTDGGLYERVRSPEPLWLVDPRWHFRDANWWPDWPTTARKLMWFYEKSGGPTVDGVIGLTPTVIERLLEIIGPIDMSEKYGRVIDADSFRDTTREIIEDSKPAAASSTAKTASSTANTPKRIIADMLQVILEKLPQELDQEGFSRLLDSIESSLTEKHILVYLTDEKSQAWLDKNRWSGRLLETNWDYLMVVNTNIAGQKTDKVIEQKIDHSAIVGSGGNIRVKLAIKRQHNGVKREPYTGVRNVNWLRVYVPLGSRLLSASGFMRPDDEYFELPDPDWAEDPDIARTEGLARLHEDSGTWIYEESGKMVFANWTMVDPGRSHTVELEYELPFGLRPPVTVKGWGVKIGEYLAKENAGLLPYALLVQKQPGMAPSGFTSRLELSDDFYMDQHYPPEISTHKNGWYIQDELKSDEFYAAYIGETEGGN